MRCAVHMCMQDRKHTPFQLVQQLQLLRNSACRRAQQQRAQEQAWSDKTARAEQLDTLRCRACITTSTESAVRDSPGRCSTRTAGSCAEAALPGCCEAL
jgi:hypothetical protein